MIIARIDFSTVLFIAALTLDIGMDRDGTIARRTVSDRKHSSLVDGADNLDALARYRFLLGVADSTGKVTRSILNLPWTEARQTTELGEIVFPKVLLDPGGDVISIKATLIYPGGQISLKDGYATDLMASTAVWRPVDDRLLLSSFQSYTRTHGA